MLSLPSRRRVARGAPIALIAVLVLALAACGYGSKKSYGTKQSHGVAGAAAGKGTITATEQEFSIALSQTSVPPGTYTFVAVNKGKLAHSLAANGPGVSNQRIPGTIPPGASKALTVTLSQGTYEVYCPVPGHKQQGMVAHVTVGMAGPSGGSSGGMTTHSSNGY